MKRSVVYAAFAAIALSMFIFSTFTLFTDVFGLRLMQAVGEQEMAFGGQNDVAFANMLWKAMKGYETWPMKSTVDPGTSPHGKFLRLYYNIVNIDQKPYHVIIKDNFGGEGATLETVSKSPAKYLAAVTVMLQREAGYDADNNDWFWVKYNVDGTLDKSPQGMALAGRVAKGLDTGCIACHSKAKDTDYLFTNDAIVVSLNAEKLLQERCTGCHKLDRVQKVRKDRSGWDKIIAKMVKEGAKVNEAERQALADYLSKKK